MDFYGSLVMIFLNAFDQLAVDTWSQPSHSCKTETQVGLNKSFSFSPISLGSNSPSPFDLLCSSLHSLAGRIKHSFKEVEGREGKNPRGLVSPKIALHDPTRLCIGGNSSASRRKALSHRTLFLWVDHPKRDGEERG